MNIDRIWRATFFLGGKEVGVKIALVVSACVETVSTLGTLYMSIYKLGRGAEFETASGHTGTYPRPLGLKDHFA